MYTETSWVTPTILAVVSTYVGAATAFMAIYVARIYKNTLGRPNYIINSRETVLPETERQPLDHYV